MKGEEEEDCRWEVNWSREWDMVGGKEVRLCWGDMIEESGHGFTEILQSDFGEMLPSLASSFIIRRAFPGSPISPKLVPDTGEESLFRDSFVLSSSVRTQVVFIPTNLHFSNLHH